MFCELLNLKAKRINYKIFGIIYIVVIHQNHEARKCFAAVQKFGPSLRFKLWRFSAVWSVSMSKSRSADCPGHLNAVAPRFKPILERSQSDKLCDKKGWVALAGAHVGFKIACYILLIIFRNSMVTWRVPSRQGR